MRQIKIFDTTLRDGAQSASANLKVEDKIKVAEQLERLNVDVIEAGFPASSEKESDVVSAIAKKSGKTIAALSRVKKEDVEKAWNAIKEAKNPRIHIFIASSESHMKNKLHMTKEEVIENAVGSIRYAKSISQNRAEIEFSAEDATRSDEAFLIKLYEEAINAGATIINIPDTVGFCLPNEFFGLVKRIRERFQNTEISVHCHNDLGLAVANSIAAVYAGADQVHCTINGIGERAGNASLEEIAAILKVRKDILDFYCNINLKEIVRTSKIVSENFGVGIPEYKAVVGRNALKHEAGVHVQYAEGYEVIRPEDIGSEREIILGKNSGIHTVFELAKMNYIEISKEEAKKLLQVVKEEDLKIDKESFIEFKSRKC